MRFNMKTIKQELIKSIISKTLNKINLNEGFVILLNEINEIEININLTMKILIKKISAKTMRDINLNLYNNVFDTLNKVINIKKEKAKAKDDLISFLLTVYISN